MAAHDVLPGALAGTKLSSCNWFSAVSFFSVGARQPNNAIVIGLARYVCLQLSVC